MATDRPSSLREPAPAPAPAPVKADVWREAVTVVVKSLSVAATLVFYAWYFDTITGGWGRRYITAWYDQANRPAADIVSQAQLDAVLQRAREITREAAG